MVAAFAAPGSASVTQPVAELPRANIRPAGKWSDEEFVLLRDVPIFAEHETTSRKTGRRLRFGPAELQAVADRCNRRIRDTGDYSAITIGHTSASAGGGPGPQVVGFAGPFRLGELPDGRRAILADFHVFREDFPRLKRYPRRSPELWVEDRYEDMTLDPISLLGAEAPRLDMGMLYSATGRDGVEIERYSAAFDDGAGLERYCAAFPGPGSAAPRGEVRVKPEKYEATHQPHEEKTVMALDENDVRQIVSAMEQLPWVQWVKAKMQAETAPAPEPAPEAPTTTTAPPAPEPVPPRDGEPEKNSRSAAGGVEALRYAKMQADLAAAQRKADEAMAIAVAEQGKRVDLERYQRLALLRDAHVFDLDEEFEQVRYGKTSDEDFQRHCQRIEKNYARIPVGHSLPIPEAAPPAASQPGGVRQAERYAREAVDKAVAYCKREREAGRAPDYADALAKAQRGEL